MPKDQLFLLQPGFFKESEGPFYCGDSVAVEGLLSFFPQLRNEVDVHYIGAPRPRAAIVALIGADNQSAPVLVLGHGRVVSDAGVETRTHNGVRFIDAPDQIRRYLSAQYGVAHASGRAARPQAWVISCGAHAGVPVCSVRSSMRPALHAPGRLGGGVGAGGRAGAGPAQL